MPLLQVRDFPQELYDSLTKLAHAENRSAPQQTIVLMREALGQPQNQLQRRRAVLERIEGAEFSLPEGAPDAADLIREDRER